MTQPPGNKTALGNRMVRATIAMAILVTIAVVVLNIPLPAPDTVNEVHSWPVPKQSAIDLLRSDWFKDAQTRPAASSKRDMKDRLLGCWKYRNGRMGSFEGSFILRKVDALGNISGHWNFDKGHALPLSGQYRLVKEDSGAHALVTLKNASGAEYGQDLLLRGDETAPYLCKLKSDPYAGKDFRAVRTSVTLKPTTTVLNEPLLGRTLAMLTGRWHEVDDKRPSQYDFGRVFEDGTFEVDNSEVADKSTALAVCKQADGGFIADGQEINLFLGDMAYLQLQLAQSGAQITLNDMNDKPVLLKDPELSNRQPAANNQNGSLWKGLINLIDEHNRH